MSTGVIRQTFPISKILTAPRPHGPLAGNTLDHGFACGTRPRAFITTDTIPLGDGRTYHVAGVVKGAGMIHPDMLGAPPPLSPSPSQAQALPHATLLEGIATDAPVAPAALQSALDYAVQRSFNAISVDGVMSTKC